MICKNIYCAGLRREPRGGYAMEIELARKDDEKQDEQSTNLMGGSGAENMVNDGTAHHSTEEEMPKDVSTDRIPCVFRAQTDLLKATIE